MAASTQVRTSLISLYDDAAGESHTCRCGEASVTYEEAGDVDRYLVREVAAMLQRYGRHARDCAIEMFYGGGRSNLAIVTMEQVLGKPVCDCGWADLGSEIRNA